MITGVNYFIMKALTVDNNWYEFSLEDIPTMIDESLFVLLGKENSPKLQLKTIRRGDPESKLYEGDVINFDGMNWLICYERGFYAINSIYVSKHLYQLSEYSYIGTCDDVDKIVPINFKSNHLFKYKDLIFRFNDITGGFDGKIIVRACKEPIEPKDIQQECCMSINKQKVYLGDCIDNSVVVLQGGRIALSSPIGIHDSTGGGSLDGCVSRPYRRS